MIDLHALNGRWPGVTVNVGVIERRDAAERRRRAVLARGGRAGDRTREALEAVEAAVRAACATTAVPDVTVDDRGDGRHWPMEKLERSGRLVDHAVALAGRLGFELADAATGGASDANTTAGMGVPTLDGLGPIGGIDHSPAEYLEVGSIVPRTTLLAALARWPSAATPRSGRGDRTGPDRRRGPWLAQSVGGSPRAARARLAWLQPGACRRATPAGCRARPTPARTARSLHPDDPAGQTRAALAIIDGALHEAGFARSDVVRTRIFTTKMRRSPEILAVHGEQLRDDRAGGHDRRGPRPDPSVAARRDRGRRRSQPLSRSGRARAPLRRTAASLRRRGRAPWRRPR